jgi:hypothetical protein
VHRDVGEGGRFAVVLLVDVKGLNHPPLAAMRRGLYDPATESASP